MRNWAASYLTRLGAITRITSGGQFAPGSQGPHQKAGKGNCRARQSASADLQSLVSRPREMKM